MTAVRMCMDEPKPQITEQARAELEDEAARLAKEDDERRKRKELLESLLEEETDETKE